jgi:hypothetical protein
MEGIKKTHKYSITKCHLNEKSLKTQINLLDEQVEDLKQKETAITGIIKVLKERETRLEVKQALLEKARLEKEKMLHPMAEIEVMKRSHNISITKSPLDGESLQLENKLLVEQVEALKRKETAFTGKNKTLLEEAKQRKQKLIECKDLLQNSLKLCQRLVKPATEEKQKLVPEKEAFIQRKHVSEKRKCDQNVRFLKRMKSDSASSSYQREKHPTADTDVVNRISTGSCDKAFVAEKSITSRANKSQVSPQQGNGVQCRGSEGKEDNVLSSIPVVGGTDGVS